MATKIEYQENEFGIVVPVEVPSFEKRELMSRDEWRAWFGIEEISEEQFLEEYRTLKRPLDM